MTRAAQENARRAEHGAAILAFADPSDEPLNDRLVDALADLAHFAKSQGLSPAELWRVALAHVGAERCEQEAEAAETIRKRLEELRAMLRAEEISWGELHELEGLSAHIAPDDVELREAAGLPEFPNGDDESPLPEPPEHLRDAWDRYRSGGGGGVSTSELRDLDEWRADCAEEAGY